MATRSCRHSYIGLKTVIVIVTSPRFQDEDDVDHCPNILFSRHKSGLDPFTVVSKAVQGFKAHAQLRVFTLGISEHVSSDMCERLARKGGCKCLFKFAVQAEDITGKSTMLMLLNASRTREIETRALFLDASSTAYDQKLISSLEYASNFNVFAITTFRSIPSEVRLLQVAKLKDLEEVLDDVDLAEIQNRAPLPSIAPASDEDIKKAEAAIVRKLGLDYQLVEPAHAFFSLKSKNLDMRLCLSTSLQRSRRLHGRASIIRIGDPASDPADKCAPGTDVSTPLYLTQKIQSSVFNRQFSMLHHGGHINSEPPRIAAPVPTEVTIISLLEFDGSFKPTPRRTWKAIVGVDTLAKAAELQVDGNKWATAVVVAYLRHHLGAQPDLLDALMNKTLEAAGDG
ncbi:hypothetical protein EDD22DRAFT_970181 [Suillus occidentalis]|nr:hypothetical protein EDD22DRAFT_970181 [Suillus occidentalis]